MDRVPRIPSRLSTLFPERVIRSHDSEETFPFSLEETKRKRERVVATEGKEVPSLNRSGFYFVRVCLPLGLLSRP